MLTKCPECELQVSDKAIACPHCGYQLIADAVQRRERTSTRRKRLPNGFGQITKIKDSNLRKPYRAMVHIGVNSNGHSTAKPLKPESYFETYNDAYAALVEYNRNPYDLSPSITIAQLYDRWTDDYFKTLNSMSSERTITSAWQYCSSVYNMRACDVRARHIKGCMEEGTKIVKGNVQHPSAGVKARIKSLFNLMLDYALEYEIVETNYARTFDVSGDIIKEKEAQKRGHQPFTDDEMTLLWSQVNTIGYIDVLLVQCYSGWRPQELGLLKIANVDLEQGIMLGGIKTDAGKDRMVPIHSKIYPFVKARYEEAVKLGSEYLFNCTDTKTHCGSTKMTYDKYRQRFDKIRDRLNLNPNHRAHDGRMHFVTQAKKYNVDEYAIKYIVGHSINDITEKVYTKREVEWFKSEIEKIK